MKHSVKHDLGRELAKKATLKAFDAYRERFAKYNPSAEWVDDNRANIRFSAKGISLKGSVEVNDSSIDMDLDVPLLLRPFKGHAMGVIEDEIRKWTDKAKSGEV